MQTSSGRNILVGGDKSRGVERPAVVDPSLHESAAQFSDGQALSVGTGFESLSIDSRDLCSMASKKTEKSVGSLEDPAGMLRSLLASGMTAEMAGNMVFQYLKCFQASCDVELARNGQEGSLLGSEETTTSTRSARRQERQALHAAACRELADRDGYCYLSIVKLHKRLAIMAELGRDPTVYNLLARLKAADVDWEVANVARFEQAEYKTGGSLYHVSVAGSGGLRVLDVAASFHKVFGNELLNPAASPCGGYECEDLGDFPMAVSDRVGASSSLVKKFARLFRDGDKDEVAVVQRNLVRDREVWRAEYKEREREWMAEKIEEYDRFTSRKQLIPCVDPFPLEPGLGLTPVLLRAVEARVTIGNDGSVPACFPPLLDACQRAESNGDVVRVFETGTLVREVEDFCQILEEYGCVEYGFCQFRVVARDIHTELKVVPRFRGPGFAITVALVPGGSCLGGYVTVYRVACSLRDDGFEFQVRVGSHGSYDLWFEDGDGRTFGDVHSRLVDSGCKWDSLQLRYVCVGDMSVRAREDNPLILAYPR